MLLLLAVAPIKASRNDLLFGTCISLHISATSASIGKKRSSNAGMTLFSYHARKISPVALSLRSFARTPMFNSISVTAEI